ncbi:thioredoxin family protein [Pseudalkalibacillus caeni]|uniref:thioredoxin family protein n=1 Tax=Exobacillus caeni TaxID=2574798 RepID=UPI001FE3FD9C|nr:thioredoxin family protein [Pseudalkalibacillus caeni]
MKRAESLEELERHIKDEKLFLIYLSQPECSVCHALLPKVESLLEKFPEIYSMHVDMLEIPETAGRFSIFTVPALLLFAEGKEVMRQARFVRVEELEHNFSKIVKLIND